MYFHAAGAELFIVFRYRAENYFSRAFVFAANGGILFGCVGCIQSEGDKTKKIAEGFYDSGVEHAVARSRLGREAVNWGEGILEVLPYLTPS